jgi:hypothetical protein
MMKGSSYALCNVFAGALSADKLFLGVEADRP